jgi:hypothetical protein
VYAVARLSCIDCKNIFHVNILDNGPRTFWFSNTLIIVKQESDLLLSDYHNRTCWMMNYFVRHTTQN